MTVGVKNPPLNIILKLPGNLPSKKNCYEIIVIGRHGALKKNDRAKEYEEVMSYGIPAVYKGKAVRISKRGKPVLEPCIKKWFRMDTIIHYKSNHADFNKELVLDILQECGVIGNDRYYLGGIEIKRFDKKDPRIELIITDLGEDYDDGHLAALLAVLRQNQDANR
jgi:hypothetical protein